MKRGAELSPELSPFQENIAAIHRISVAQLDPKAVWGEYLRRPVGPLYYTHAISGQLLLQAQVPGLLGAAYPVKVHVVEDHPSLVLGHQDECGAAGVAGDPQSPSDSLGQAGFSGAQRTGQQIYIAGPGLFADRPSHGPGLLGTVGADSQATSHGVSGSDPSRRERRRFLVHRFRR